MKKARNLLLSLTLVLLICAQAVPLTRAFPMGQVGMISTVATGRLHTAALKTDGTLWTWGDNTYGQLGNGTTTDAKTPQKIMDNVVSVSCGSYFTAAIKSDGSLWVWGSDRDGQLGIGGSGNATAYGVFTIQTVPVMLMDNVEAVSCGSFYAAAIKTDGSLWVWGTDPYALTVNESVVNDTIPVKVMDDVKAVSCGSASMYTTLGILKKDNSLWMWGWNGFGQLGDGTTTTATTPEKVMDSVAAVCCGSNHTLILKEDGSLWACGKNDYGQLGNGSTKNSSTPVKVMDGVAAAACENFLSVALKKDGSVWTWGKNDDGQLGNGTTTSSGTPTKVLENVAEIACCDHVAAVKENGELWLWGYNPSGQIGDGSKTNVTTPTKILTDVALPSSMDALSALDIDGSSSTASSTPAQAVVVDASAGHTNVGGFQDVYADDYYAEAVVWAKDSGVTSGTGEGVFSPDNTVTRAQAMTFLWVAAGRPEPTSLSSPFADVKDSSAYYYKAILWAAEQGITSGVDATHFGVNNTLAYDQIFVFLCKAAGDSLSGGDWSQAAQTWARDHGLTDGLSFSTKGGCPRSDVVYFLWKQLA